MKTLLHMTVQEWADAMFCSKREAVRQYVGTKLNRFARSENRVRAAEAAAKWALEVRSAFPSARAAYKCEYRNARYVFGLMTAEGALKSLV